LWRSFIASQGPRLAPHATILWLGMPTMTIALLSLCHPLCVRAFFPSVLSCFLSPLGCFFLFLAAASLRCVYSHLFHGTIAYHWVTLSHPIAPPLPPPSFKSLPLTHVHRPSFSPGATPPRSAVFFFGRAPSSPECHDTGLAVGFKKEHAHLLSHYLLLSIVRTLHFCPVSHRPSASGLPPSEHPRFYPLPLCFSALSPRLHLSNLSVRRRRRGSALVPCDSLVAGSLTPLPPISGQHHWLFPRHF